jgi:hypothetical protein
LKVNVQDSNWFTFLFGVFFGGFEFSLTLVIGDEDARGAQSYGGVLIAINKEFISTEVSELKTDCEIVWTQINMSGSKNLLIGAYYRPPSDKGTSLQLLELSLSRIIHASRLISSMISKSLMLSSVSGLPGIPCGIDESM